LRSERFHTKLSLFPALEAKLRGQNGPHKADPLPQDACGQFWHPADCNTNQSHVTAIVYNTLSRKIRAAAPDMGNWSYQHDDVGNIDAEKQTTPRDGRQVHLRPPRG
jgi:hypothetical protein